MNIYKVLLVITSAISCGEVASAKNDPAAFINSTAVIFKMCSATGDNIISKYANEKMTVLIEDSGIYVVRANKNLEPYFTADKPCFEQNAADTECEADELDSAVNLQSVSHIALTKRCGNKLEDSIPEASRSIPAHLDLIVNYQIDAAGAKTTANGILNCVGPNNMNTMSGLTLSDCQ